MKDSVTGLDSWEIEDWIERLGSMPKSVLEHEDFSQTYEQDSASVLELENGKFALVTESGCSCYTSSDADIDLFPTKEAAMVSFDEWKRIRKLGES